MNVSCCLLSINHFVWLMMLKSQHLYLRIFLLFMIENQWLLLIKLILFVRINNNASSVIQIRNIRPRTIIILTTLINHHLTILSRTCLHRFRYFCHFLCVNTLCYLVCVSNNFRNRQFFFLFNLFLVCCHINLRMTVNSCLDRIHLVLVVGVSSWFGCTVLSHCHHVKGFGRVTCSSTNYFVIANISFCFGK